MSAKNVRLRPVATLDIPVKEASALAVARRGEDDVLVAVGDRDAALAVSVLLDGRPQEWQRVDLSDAFAAVASDGTQLEGVATDAQGHILLAQEDPSRVFVLDPEFARITHVLDLDAGTDAALAQAWERDENSKVEAIVPGPGGQLLVVKEKKPICLAMFAPTTSAPATLADLRATPKAWASPLQPGRGTLRAVGSWPAGKSLLRLGDISDAAIGPDGSLFLLSDQSAAIVRVDDLPEPGEKVSAAEMWEIDGWPDKCEGIAFDSQGYCYVAIDSPKAASNLLVFDQWRG